MDINIIIICGILFRGHLMSSFMNIFHINGLLKYKCLKNLKKKTITNQSSLRTLDASGKSLSSAILSLPDVVLYDSIETLHLSFYNGPLYLHFSSLRNITLVNSINCLNYFPTTIRSVRILLFYTYPNYIPPNWTMILDSLSFLPQLNLLRVFMYDMAETIDHTNCQTIAKMARLCNEFGFCFRRKFSLLDDVQLEPIFEDHIKFIKLLYNHILLLCLDKQLYHLIDADGCGLTMWF